MAKCTPRRSRPCDGEVARLLGAAGEQHRVIVALELRDAEMSRPTWTLQWKVTPSASICSTRRSTMILLHLEVGDAVAEQAAGMGVLLVDMHVVAGAGELLGRGKSGRTGADDGDALAGLRLRRLRPHPALGEGLVGDGAFDRLDGDRHVDDVERAGGLARRRADAAGHLGEIVGRVEVAAPPPASRRDRRGRSSPGSGCSPGSRCGNRGCRNPCSARPGWAISASLERHDELAVMANAIGRRLIAPVLRARSRESP